MRTLERAAYNTIFTLSGNHIMSLFDAAIDTRHRLVHTRHEAAAVHMADAWGRLTGEPGIAMVTGGPGHANAAGRADDGARAGIAAGAAVGPYRDDAAWPRRLSGTAPGRDGGAGGEGVVDCDVGRDARRARWRRRSASRGPGGRGRCISACRRICSMRRLRPMRSCGRSLQRSPRRRLR